MGMLLEQSLRGALAVVLVCGLNRWLAPTVRAESRRWLWLLAVPAFLLPWKIALLPAAVPHYLDFANIEKLPLMVNPAVATTGDFAVSVSWPVVVWLSGVLLYLAWMVTLTVIAQRKWAREKFCTDSRLLELLEDCKQLCGVMAPIGLVVTSKVETPALLGWLRPRILLPSALMQTLTAAQFKAVLLHELTHFRRLDIPMGWLLALVNAVHWFNPTAWFMVGEWQRFREEAADEAVQELLQDANGELYGGTLLAVLRGGNGAKIPFGSLAIGESMQNLTRRMEMIKNYRKKSAGYGVMGICVAALMAVALVVPARAESEEELVLKQATAWMQLTDEGKYGEAWNETSDWFKSQITKDTWQKLCAGTRPGLGKLLKREKANVMKMTSMQAGGGANNIRRGDFMALMFNSSFENLTSATEVVGYEKNGDGKWIPNGYYVKPR